MHSMASCNSLYPFLLIVLSFVCITTKGQSACAYNNKGYAECEFMFWLNWTACDGRDFPLEKENVWREYVVFRTPSNHRLSLNLIARKTATLRIRTLKKQACILLTTQVKNNLGFIYSLYDQNTYIIFCADIFFIII